MNLYKYSNSYYARGLAQIGLYRIGTLGDFRKLEHLEGISDTEEGVKFVNVDIENEVFKTGADIPKNLASLGLIRCDDSSTNITLTNIHTTHTLIAPDAYIWCASTEKSAEVMSQFGGANTCVEIQDVPRFITVLNQIMLTMDVIFLGVFEVQYRNRSENWERDSLGLHPALIKSLDFQLQKEVRAIWVPRHSDPIESTHGRCDGLANYCRVVAV